MVEALFLPSLWGNQCEGIENADVAQLVEHDLAKVGVAGSSLVIRSRKAGFA